MYTLTPPNSPKHKPMIQGKKPQNPSVTRNGTLQSSANTQNAPLFGQYRPPRYTADEYESLGLKKLSIALDIKDEIKDDLSDEEFFKRQAQKEQAIAEQKAKDSKWLEQKARKAFFKPSRDAYRREALRTKESMFFHEDSANIAATKSERATIAAQEKTKERITLLEEGNNLLDRAEQLKRPLYSAPKYVYPTRGNAHGGHSSSSSHHTSVRVSSSTTYQRGKFHMPDSIFPETIFEEEEPGFMPPPPPRRHSSSSKKPFTEPQPDYYYFAKPKEPTSAQERQYERPSNSFQNSFAQNKSHTFPLGSKKAGQPPRREHKRPQPDIPIETYYSYMEPETQADPKLGHKERSSHPFQKSFAENKSHTFPGPGQPPLREHKRPQPKPFSTARPRAATWDVPPAAPPSDFGVNQQEPPFIDPSFSWDDVFSRKSAKQGESSKQYFEEPESYGQGQPDKPPVFVELNEKNFKYENWMPEKWQTFTKVPVAIKDVYGTEELGQLFSIAVKGIVRPTETKQVQVEENGEKKSRIKIKTSKEMFRDWKVKTHSDKANEEDAKIYAALGVLFDEGDKQVYEFNKEGQAIRVRRSRGKQAR